MVNIQEFLLENNIDVGEYALVSYNEKTEPIYFAKYNFGDGDWFLESPCELFKIMEVKSDIESFCIEYVKEYMELDEGITEEDYINKYVKPMIMNGYLYEINNFQCPPYLPKEVDDIKLIT